MPSDTERLVVQFEARLRDFEKAQRRIEKTNRSFEKLHRNAAAGSRDMERNVNRASNRMVTAMERTRTQAAMLGRTMIGVFGAGVVLSGARRYLDASTQIQNALRVTGLEGQKLNDVYDQLFAAAQKNAAPLEALTQLYGRAAQVQNELGVSTQELLGFTENVAVALRVSGRSAQESSGALMQLAQSLGSGIVRAEEFNSILEGALPIAQAAAAGLEEAGGSVAKLRQLVIDGKVSSEAFFRAFEAGSVTLEEKVANAELTVSQHMVRLQNVLIDTIGQFDDAAGASGAAGDALGALAQTVQEVGDFFEANQEPIRQFIGLIEGDLNDAMLNLREESGWADFIDPLLGGLQGATQGTGDFADGASRARAELGYFLDTYLSATSAIPGLTPELRAQMEVISQGLEQNTLDAQDAMDALNGIGEANPASDRILSGLQSILGGLVQVQNAAVATANTIAQIHAPETLTQLQMMRAGFEPTMLSPRPTPTIPQVSLDDYPLGGGGSGGSGGGGGRSHAISEAEKQANAIQDVIDKLEFERAQLGRTNEEQELYALLKQAGVERNSAFGKSIEEAFVALQKDKGAREYFENLKEQSEDAAQEVADTLGDVLGSLFDGPIESADQFFDKMFSGFASLGQAGFSQLGERLFGGKSTGTTPTPTNSVGDALSKIPAAVQAGAHTGAASGVPKGFSILSGKSGQYIGAGLGGLGIGYQTQDPVMGAIGGGLSGISASIATGNPIPMILGALGGLKGGRIHIHRRKEAVA